MASRLTPCPSCTRHVKVGSSACPFCGGDVPVDVPARAMPTGRPLTRAAILFASAAAVSACSSSTPTTGGAKDAEIDHLGQGMPLYGVFTDAVAPGSGTGSGSGFGEPDGGPVAAYGVFIDAAQFEDAGHVQDGSPVAAYGVFPHPDASVNDAGHDARSDGQSVAAYGVFPHPDSGQN